MKLFPRVLGGLVLVLLPAVGDVTLARRDFPADSLLGAWIRNPPAFRPLTKMPPYQGILKEEEYAPLAAYVRKLGETAR